MDQFKNKKLNKLENTDKLIREPENNSNILIEIKNLKTYFPVYGGIFRRIKGYVKAVDGVNFNLYKGEIFGLVGESGCGKSTVGRSIIRLYKPNSGNIFFHDKALLNNNENQNIKIDLTKLNRKEMLSYRSNIQMIFQDPYSSLNPRFTVMDIIEEPLKIHKSTEKLFVSHKAFDLFCRSNAKNKDENTKKVFELLDKVGLSKENALRFPHEFSGGQRQRIGIARALSTNPKLIIADEPVSALDVSIQAQVINLIQDLQEELKITYLFIAHDLSVVKHIANRVGVMYLGNIVEIGNALDIYEKPHHPYTHALLSSVPSPDPKTKNKRIILKGDVPSPLNKPSGCSFHTRCPIAKDICKTKEPEYVESEKDHLTKCFFPL